jgi:hypothetical protein
MLIKGIQLLSSRSLKKLYFFAIYILQDVLSYIFWDVVQRPCLHHGLWVSLLHPAISGHSVDYMLGNS